MDKEIIEFYYDAVKSGYSPNPLKMAGVYNDEGQPETIDCYHVMLVDPKAWEAVGKTRGWRDVTEGTFKAEFTCWQAYWDGFWRCIREQMPVEEALNQIKK